MARGELITAAARGSGHCCRGSGERHPGPVMMLAIYGMSAELGVWMLC